MTNRYPYNAPLKVLVAAVTAAERKQPMPSTADLVDAIGCAPHSIAMAVTRLEKAGVIQRLSEPGGRRRIMIVQTGAATAPTKGD